MLLELSRDLTDNVARVGLGALDAHRALGAVGAHGTRAALGRLGFGSVNITELPK